MRFLCNIQTMALVKMTLLLLIQLTCLEFCQAACTWFLFCQHPYIIILDAGSTGTRINVYQFERSSGKSSDVRILSEKSIKSKDKFGIDSMAYAPNRVAEYLNPLFEFAKTVIPANEQSETPIFLGATAGVRKVPYFQRQHLMIQVARELRNTPFKTEFHGERFKDKHLAMLLSGRHEGSLATSAVNFLMKDNSTKYDMLDIGGGSVQISKDGDTAITILGLGKSAATLEILGFRNETLTSVHKSPCLSPNYSGMFNFGGKTIKVEGVENASPWETCTELAGNVLAKFQIKYNRCENKLPYVAISSVFHVAKTLSKLGYLNKPIPGEVTVQDFQDAAEKACRNPPATGQFEPYVCIDGAYITQLLNVGFKLGSSDRLFITDKINSISPGWSVGLAWYFIDYPTALGGSVYGDEGYNEGRNAY